jgi:hypothetical protein
MADINLNNTKQPTKNNNQLLNIVGAVLIFGVLIFTYLRQSSKANESTNVKNIDAIKNISDSYFNNKPQLESNEKEAEFSISTIDPETRRNIISILNRYYEVNQSSVCDELAEFYLPLVENYYNKKNISTYEFLRIA